MAERTGPMHGVQLSPPQPSCGEPWVQLATGAELAGWSRGDEVAYSQQSRQLQKLAFFVNAFDCLSANQIQGDYFEFGCHRARTFRMALTEARRHHLDDMRFLAFDSFEGLPQPIRQTDVSGYLRGALHTSEAEFCQLIEEHGVSAHRYELIKGLYQNTLTEQLQERFRASNRKIALVCIDCDLYESSLPIFRFIEPFLQEGSLLYIDDYFVGYKGSPMRTIARAFQEYEQVSRFQFTSHMQVGWWGRSFIAYLGGVGRRTGQGRIDVGSDKRRVQ